LWAIGKDSVPNGICIFGMTGGNRKWRVIEVPQSVLDPSPDDQPSALLRYMNQHKEQHNGAVPFFGVLTGFKFVRLVDYFQFNAPGRLVEHVHKPFRLGGCSVSLT
jgi:hypothetical protein